MMAKLIFLETITLVFSVTCSFGDHSNMLIWCSINIFFIRDKKHYNIKIILVSVEINIAA